MKPSLALTVVIAFALASCKEQKDPENDSAESPDSTTSSAENGGLTESSTAKKVDMPDDSFFTVFAYPGATPANALTMGGATSVWFKTKDDFEKITAFYHEKFKDGNNSVTAKRGYFMQPNAEGGPIGATINLQPDGSTQIILKREHK